MAGERWRNLVDRLKSVLDRFTHSRHRRRARARFNRNRRPERVLLVCSGNICRSPYARDYFRAALDRAGIPDVAVESAGFFGPGRPANERGAAIALKRGIDLGDHRSQLIPSVSGQFDLFLVMTRRHRDDLIGQFSVSRERVALLGDFDLADPPNREIEDPYGRHDEVFEKVFAQIERSIDGLCQCLRQ